MNKFNFYASQFATFISSGNLLNRDKISLLGLKPMYGRFLTHSYITKAWYVFGVPVHYEHNLTELVSKEMFHQFPSVRTVVHMYCVPTSIDVQNKLYLQRKDEAEDAYLSYKRVLEAMSTSKQQHGAKLDLGNGRKLIVSENGLREYKDRYDALAGMYEAITENQQVFDVNYFIQASAKTKRELDDYQKQLLGLLSMEGVAVDIAPIRSEVTTYLRNYAPGGNLTSDAVKKFPAMLMTEQNVAHFLPATMHGLINPKGTVIGKDVESGLPFFLDFTESGAGQATAIVGKAGSGKTYTMEEIAQDLLHRKLHGSVIDFKGNEWEKLLKYVRGVKFDCTGDNAFFVNTLRLDDLKCDKNNCADAFEDAVSWTIDLFSIAVCLLESEGNKKDLEDILEHAVRNVLQVVNKNDPTTFSKTRDLKYAMVLEAVRVLESSKSYTLEQKKLCQLILTRCNKIFGDNGNSTYFKQELTLQEILDIPFIIYALNKNVKSTLSVIDSLRVHMIRVLNSKKYAVRREEGKSSFVIYEEVQRYGDEVKLSNGVVDDVTGKRSDKLQTFLLMNSLTVLNLPHLRAVKSNIATKIVGKVEQFDEEILCTELGCAPIREMLVTLREESESHPHHFACMYDTGARSGVCMFQTVVPENMSKALATGTFDRGTR